MKLKLNPIPDEAWKDKFDKVMENPYIKTKYDREKRIKEKKQYIKDYLPEVHGGEPKNILDIGPGPGEFMEICRWYGHDVWGVDAMKGDCEMGEEYLELSMLMNERQKLDVWNWGARMVFTEDISFPFPPVNIVNCQGAIEQIFKDHLEGPPHIEHHDARQLSWIESDKLNEDFLKFFSGIDEILAPGGILLIYANGAKNTIKYHNLLMATMDKLNYKNVFSNRLTLHKFEKSE